MTEQIKIYTKGDYKRLSERIRKSPNEVSADDYIMLQDLRVTYKKPLAEVFNSLFKFAHKVNSDCICTYRIKRIESIVSKLLRFKDMEVQRIADIAGCRCVMATESDVINLLDSIKRNEKYLPFFVKNTNDYIANPKKNGYRSVHLNVQMRDDSKKVIEIQIRSLEHHNWATLVEISDLLFNSKLKEYDDEINPELYEFHKILAKQDAQMSLMDKKQIVRISGKYRYLEKVGKIFNKNSLDLRLQRNKLSLRKKSYFLISTGIDGAPKLFAFESFDAAEDAYFNMFSNNPNNNNIVLTHMSNMTFEKLSVAYSNYFLTYNATLFRILAAISDVTINSYNWLQLYDFKKNYRAFWFIVTIWYGERLKETDVFNNDSAIRKSKKKKNEWYISITSSIRIVNQIINSMMKGFRSDLLHWGLKFYKKRLDAKIRKEILSRLESRAQ